MIQLSGWALTLGASSGFGEAVSLALARAGLNIFGVHLDRKATQGNVERIVGEIKALGREALFFNVNAADLDKRAEVVARKRCPLRLHLEGRALDGDPHVVQRGVGRYGWRQGAGPVRGRQSMQDVVEAPDRIAECHVVHDPNLPPVAPMCLRVVVRVMGGPGRGRRRWPTRILCR